MRLLFTVVPVLFVSAALYGADLSLFGYFEPQLVGSRIDGEFLQLNTNKVRLDLSSQISEEISFTGNVNYIAYTGQTSWNLLDFVPAELSGPVVKVGSVQAYTVDYKDQQELDNAYLRMYLGRTTVTAGRQQISVGSGYSYNPTDMFNFKDVLDPTYEQPGVDGVRVEVGISDGIAATLFYSPESTWEESGRLIRVVGRLSHFDIALSAGQRFQTVTDFSTFAQSHERRDMLGGDINGELLGLGIWSENAHNDIATSPDYWENLAGIDYTFTSGWYWVIEYYHNERGSGNKADYTFNAWLRYLTGEVRTLARDQIYLFTEYPMTDLLSVGGSIIQSLSDESVLLVPTARYSVADNIELTAFGYLYTGKAGAMYSADMGNGALVRMRAYF